MRRYLPVALSLALVACHTPAAVNRLPATTPAGPEAASLTTSKVVADATRSTVVAGQVVFPKAMTTQASAAYVANAAVLSLIEPQSNLTVVIGKTDESGNFTLDLNGYSPDPAKVYLLEAYRGLGNNAAGNSAARLRTYLRWTGAAWTSITQGAMTLNTLTTALALISGMDASVTPASLIGKVNGSSLISAPTGYTTAEVDALAASLRSYLTGDLDPVASVSGLTPAVTGFMPPTGGVSAAIAINGSGFSPLPGDNTVVFGGNATGSVFMATPRQLIAIVPAGATTGNVTVTTRGKTSNGANFVVTAGGGSGGPGGFYVAELSPNNGVPGDFVNIMGAGFSPTAANNSVTFQKSGGGTVSVFPTYADATSLALQIPANAISGPVSVTVGGSTSNRFYFNVNVPTILSFNPTSGGPGTEITVNGSNFGAQGLQSGIKFNGTVNNSGIMAWGANQSTVTAPGPSLAAKVSGPIVLSTSAGGLSQPYGAFTASTSIVETFTGSAGAGTTASWSGGKIQPAAAVSTFTQSDFSANTNSAGAKADASGVTIASLPLQVGSYDYDATAGYNARTQLGVDTAYFFAPGSTAKSVRRYSLTTGAFVDSTNLTYGDAVIWSPSNGYASIAANADQIFRFAGWGGANFTSYTAASATGIGGSTHGFLATDGTTYYHFNCGSHAPYLRNASLAQTGTWPASPYSCGTGPASAAGFTGGTQFLTNPSSATTISYLDRFTSASWTQNAVALPFAISGSGVTGAGMPLLGSDGTFLYILGRNAGYNGNNISLFKFSYSGGVVASVPFATTCTSVTTTINRASDAIWDVVSFTRNVPAGSTCTIDVLDGSGNVLKANVSSGTSLNDVTATSIKLRATLQLGGATQPPSVSTWAVTTRKAYAVSPTYDSGTNFATCQASTVTSNGVAGTDYTITYSGSNDSVAWGADVASFATLNQRYVRFKVNFKTSGAQITGITMPYQY